MMNVAYSREEDDDERKKCIRLDIQICDGSLIHVTWNQSCMSNKKGRTGIRANYKWHRDARSGVPRNTSPDSGSMKDLAVGSQLVLQNRPQGKKKKKKKYERKIERVVLLRPSFGGGNYVLYIQSTS